MSNYENTHSQINQQRNSGHERPTVLISRHDESIQTAQLLNECDSEGRPFVVFNNRGEEVVKPIAIKNLSDDNQEQLANALAKSAERSPEDWQRTTQKNLGDTALDAVEIPRQEIDSITSIPKENEASENKGLPKAETLTKDFIDQYETPINEMALKQSRVASVFDESSQLLSHFKMRSITKQQLTQDLNDKITQARSLINQDDKSLVSFLQKATELSHACEEIAKDIILSDEADDEKYKIKTIEQAAADIQDNLRKSMNVSDDFSTDLKKAQQLLNELQADKWGGESYVAQLQQTFNELSQTSVERMRRLKLTESEFVSLRSVINK